MKNSNLPAIVCTLAVLGFGHVAGARPGNPERYPIGARSVGMGGRGGFNHVIGLSLVTPDFDHYDGDIEQVTTDITAHSVMMMLSATSPL